MISRISKMVKKFGHTKWPSKSWTTLKAYISASFGHISINFGHSNPYYLKDSKNGQKIWSYHMSQQILHNFKGLYLDQFWSWFNKFWTQQSLWSHGFQKLTKNLFIPNDPANLAQLWSPISRPVLVICQENLDSVILMISRIPKLVKKFGHTIWASKSCTTLKGIYLDQI